jgi:hypothetical protein
MAATAAIVSAAAAAYDATEKRKIKKEEAKAEDKRYAEEKELKEKELVKKSEVFQTQKKNLLKVKLASQKAQMGADGLDSGSRSSNALMGRIEKDTDEELKNYEFFLDLNLDDLNSLYNYKKRKNLLSQESSSHNFRMDLFDAGMDVYKALSESEKSSGGLSLQ